MSDRRKCTFTIETGPISASSYEATAHTLRSVIQAVVPLARADMKLTCTPSEESAPASRVIDRSAN